MKIFFVFSLVICSLSLYASMGSSIVVPSAEHIKYTFGNHKNQPVQRMEEARYLNSLAPLSKEKIQTLLEEKGYTVKRIVLKDIASELVYEVYGDTRSSKRLKLYIDPANAAILKQEPMQ